MKRGRDIFLEADNVLSEELFSDWIDHRGPQNCPGVVVLCQYSLLARCQTELLKIDSQRQDSKQFIAMSGDAITKEQNSEVAPTLGPELIHPGGRGVQAEETLIVVCEHCAR